MKDMNFLYVGTRNIGRSQIAEAYHKRLGGKAESAGIKVHYWAEGLRLRHLEGTENLIKAMRKISIYEISGGKLTSLSQHLVDRADKIIVMAEPEAYPHYLKRNAKVEHWEIEDPFGKELETYERVRDEITSRIDKMFKEG